MMLLWREPWMLALLLKQPWMYMQKSLPRPTIPSFTELTWFARRTWVLQRPRHRKASH